MTSDTPKTLLDVLREHSTVACDTFDLDIVKQLGPFVDGTSNQAIAYNELTRNDEDGNLIHSQLIKEAVSYAKINHTNYPGTSGAELTVEVMTVKLALRLVPHLTRYSLVQTNPRYCYNKEKTIDNAKRFVAIFRDLDPNYDVKRVCVKIPATWEGMQACRELEAQGIATLATTLFSMQQATLAAHVDCTLVAPYINELRVHFDENYKQPQNSISKAITQVKTIQNHYQAKRTKTKVMPASLTSTKEVMALVGSHNITVSPPLLLELASTLATSYSWDASSVEEAGKEEEVDVDFDSIVHDESTWRLAFTRREGGLAEGKLIQAINIFCEKQEALEELARRYIALASASDT